MKVRELSTNNFNLQCTVNSSQNITQSHCISEEPLEGSHQVAQSTAVREITFKGSLRSYFNFPFVHVSALNCVRRIIAFCSLPLSISCMNPSYWQALTQHHMERECVENAVSEVSSKVKPDLRGTWH